MKNKVLTLALALSLTLGCLTGCSESTDSTVTDSVTESSQTESSSQAETTTTTTAATPETTTTTEATTIKEPVVVEQGPSKEQATAAFKELMEKAVAYAKAGDIEGFKTLYVSTETDTEKINSQFKYFKDEIVKDAFPDFAYTTLAGDGKFFICYMMNSIATVNGADTDAMWKSCWMTVSYIDGKWGIDLTKESLAYAGKDETTMSILPDELKDAIKANRDTLNFVNDDYSWVNEDIVVKGYYDIHCYLAWKNADGSASFLVNLKNGTNRIIHVNSISIRLTGEKLGVVADSSKSANISLAPNHSQNYILTIPASELKNKASWANEKFNVNAESTY